MCTCGSTQSLYTLLGGSTHRLVTHNQCIDNKQNHNKAAPEFSPHQSVSDKDDYFMFFVQDSIYMRLLMVYIPFVALMMPCREFCVPAYNLNPSDGRLQLIKEMLAVTLHAKLQPTFEPRK